MTLKRTLVFPYQPIFRPQLLHVHSPTTRVYTTLIPIPYPYPLFYQSNINHNGWWQRKLAYPYRSIADKQGAKAIHKREVAQKKGANAGPTSQLKANAVRSIIFQSNDIETND